MEKSVFFKEKFAFFKNKTKELYLKNKKIFLGVFALMILICVMLFSSISSKMKNKKDTLLESQNVSVSNFQSSLESKLESMILKVKGVEFADVLVMIESTPKVNFLFEKEEVKNTSEKGDSSTIKESIVMEKNGSNSSPVVVSTTLPKVTGVLIVMSKVSPSTKVSIINSLSIVLNVDESCISILQEK